MGGSNSMCGRKMDAREHNHGSRSSRRHGGGRSQRKLLTPEEELFHRQAFSMAIQEHQLSQRFDGSMSRRIGSTSSRRRDIFSTDPLSKEKQAPEIPESIKSMKIVLVHGEGFGAWCWYKTIALMEEAGCTPVAIDLTGSGIELTDTNCITTMAEYSKPLSNYMESLPEDEKVILVGHSVGGACISYALEHFAQKIAKAVFLCGVMVTDGQKPFDVFAEELGSAERLMEQKQLLVYGNGVDKPPTGFMFEKQQMKGLYFNQSPSKDVALAMVSMRPTPLGPIMEKLALTPEKYGTGRRFFVQTLDDLALSPDVQEKLVRESPPERVFKIKGSDHCPFFSKPQSLHKILLEIAMIQ